MSRRFFLNNVGSAYIRRPSVMPYSAGRPVYRTKVSYAWVEFTQQYLLKMFFPQTDKRHLSSTERTPMLALTSVRALMSYSEASAPNGCDPWSTRAEYDLDCRSEERRVGKEWVSKCRLWWSPEN